MKEKIFMINIFTGHKTWVPRGKKKKKKKRKKKRKKERKIDRNKERAIQIVDAFPE